MHTTENRYNLHNWSISDITAIHFYLTTFSKQSSKQYGF